MQVGLTDTLSQPGWTGGDSASPLIAEKLTPNRVRCRGRRYLMIRQQNPAMLAAGLVGVGHDLASWREGSE